MCLHGRRCVGHASVDGKRARFAREESDTMGLFPVASVATRPLFKRAFKPLNVLLLYCVSTMSILRYASKIARKGYKLVLTK